MSPTSTMTDASKSALFPHCHRIDAAFSLSVFDALVEVS
jgi:hypothetical protein